jgi:hypothetical protein
MKIKGCLGHKKYLRHPICQRSNTLQATLQTFLSHTPAVMNDGAVGDGVKDDGKAFWNVGKTTGILSTSMASEKIMLNYAKLRIVE